MNNFTLLSSSALGAARVEDDCFLFYSIHLQLFYILFHFYSLMLFHSHRLDSLFLMINGGQLIHILFLLTCQYSSGKW